MKAQTLEPSAPEPKRRGRPPLAPDAPRAPETHPRSVRLTDDEWAELQARGVRGGKGTLSHWLSKKSQ